MWIKIETFPCFWSIWLFVEPLWIVGELLHHIRLNFDNPREMRIRDHVPLMYEQCVLLFQGRDLLEHPTETLQMLGVSHGDRLIVRDKRPFLVEILMHRTDPMEVKVDFRDTLFSLKKKIERLVGIPSTKQKLCHVTDNKHIVLTDDSIPLTSYHIEKAWREYKASEYQVWLYTVDNHRPEAEFRPSSLDSSSPSDFEIVLQFSLDDQCVNIPVKSSYEVDKFMRLIRCTNCLNVIGKTVDDIGMVLFRHTDLLLHGSSTFRDLGIHDQAKLIVPKKGPFNLSFFFSSSPKCKSEQYCVEVEAQWSVQSLKESIEIITNIPVKKQRLCYISKGYDDKDYHVDLIDDSVTLGGYGIVTHGQGVGLSTEEDHCSKEYEEAGPANKRQRR